MASKRVIGRAYGQKINFSFNFLMILFNFFFHRAFLSEFLNFLSPQREWLHENNQFFFFVLEMKMTEFRVAISYFLVELIKKFSKVLVQQVTLW